MESLARVIVALILLALVVNLVRRGPSGVTDWWRAKFLGRAPVRRREAVA
jgi:hypothetical protein